MKRFAAFAVLAIAALAFGQKTGAQKIVERQIAAYCQAVEKGNIKGVQSVMSPDFAATDRMGRKIDTKKAIAELEQLFKNSKSIKMGCTITSFKLAKGVAHLRCRNVLDLVVAANGRTAKIHSDSTSDETWVPTNGTYKIKASKQLTSKTTVDGKPVSLGG